MAVTEEVEHRSPPSSIVANVVQSLQGREGDGRASGGPDGEGETDGGGSFYG